MAFKASNRWPLAAVARASGLLPHVLSNVLLVSLVILALNAVKCRQMCLGHSVLKLTNPVSKIAIDRWMVDTSGEKMGKDWKDRQSGG